MLKEIALDVGHRRVPWRRKPSLHYDTGWPIASGQSDFGASCQALGEGMIQNREATVTKSELKSRLDELGQHIDRAEQRLKLKGLFSADHQIKVSELLERYEALSRKLEAEVVEEEAHGHHVSNLERSVRQWLDSLEIDLD